MLALVLNRHTTSNGILTAILNAVHMLLAFVMCWWAYCMGAADAAYQRGITFQVFVRIMPSDDLAIVFGVVGALGLAAAFAQSRAISLGVAILLGTTHMWIAITVFRGDHGSTGVGAYIALGLIGYLLVWARLRTKWA